MQENQNNNQNQHRCLDQGLIDFVNRGVHEHRGVERHRIDEPLRESARQVLHLGLDRLLDLQRIGAGRLVDADAGGLLAVKGEVLTVSLRAELDPTDIAQAGDLAIVAGLHDDVLVLADVL